MTLPAPARKKRRRRGTRLDMRVGMRKRNETRVTIKRGWCGGGAVMLGTSEVRCEGLGRGSAMLACDFRGDVGDDWGGRSNGRRGTTASCASELR